MRRSAAPSQLGKRKFFTPPTQRSQVPPEEAAVPSCPDKYSFLHDVTNTSASCREPSNKLQADTEAREDQLNDGHLSEAAENSAASSTDCFTKIPTIFKPPSVASQASRKRSLDMVVPSKDEDEELEETKDLSGSRKAKQIKFKSPSVSSVEKKSQQSKITGLDSMKPASQNVNSKTSTQDGMKTLYYNTVWAKVSKKKHKKWEEDGILIVKGRSATLLDMNSKQLAHTTSYPASELASLTDGSSLTLGGKELEVMGQVSEDNFTSGRCFMGESSSGSTDDSIKKSVQLLSKAGGSSGAFVNPSKSKGSTASAEPPEILQPRHDPTRPDALVFPDIKGSKVLVVGDPYLTRHLRPHQREGVVFLYECIMGLRSQGLGAILADEMGLGKTLQCITLIWTLLKQGPLGRPVAKKVLIVTPGSLVKNWSREFKKWLGNERLSVFAVGPDAKTKDFATVRQPVLILSYEMLLRTIGDIENVCFDLVVCDEGHRLKNTSIKSSTLIAGLKCQRRIILTGTPVQNDLQEFYSLVSLVNPGLLGSAASFRRVYEEPIVSSRQPGAQTELVELGQERASELGRLTAAFVLRRTADTNKQYLPARNDVVLFCRPTPEQLSVYKHLLSSSIVCGALNATGDSAQHLRCISMLRKLCNHPSLVTLNESPGRATDDDDDQSNIRDSSGCDVTASGKMLALSALLQSIQQQGTKEKIVVVSSFTQVLDLLESLCRQRSYTFLRLDGQTSTSKRMEIVDKFNSNHAHYFVFLLSSKAGGVGLNLIGASRLVIFDVDWNPANDLQAMGRIWRDGQKSDVVIYRLLTTGTIEEKIYQRQLTKLSLSSSVVDAKVCAMHFSTEELRDLFTLEDDTVCATHDLLVCECQGKKTRPGKATQALQVDELMNWNHVEGPDPSMQAADPCLVNCELSQVSFAFWTQFSSSSKLEQNTESNDPSDNST